MKLNAGLDSVKNGVLNLLGKLSDTMSPPGRVLKHLPSDTPLRAVDGIHSKRVLLKNKAYINLKFEGHPVSQVPADLIPMLVVGSRYKNKDRLPDKQAQKRNFTIAGRPSFFRDKTGVKWCKLSCHEGFEVNVRLLELARALFLQNVHLARTAFRPDGLAGLARVERDEAGTHIRFGRLSDYPVSNLRSKSARAHLAWLLLDEEAKRSFGSIFAHWTQSDSELWHFKFNPPGMDGWSIEGAGKLAELQDKKIFVVNEITGLHNPNFKQLGKVLMHHPRFREPVAVAPQRGKRPEITPSDDDPQLDLTSMPRLGKRLDRKTEQHFSFTFGHDLDAELDVVQKTSQITPVVNKERTPKKDTSGVGHAEERGDSLELDYGINRDSEESEQPSELIQAEPTDKFGIFRQVIEELQQRNGFDVGEINFYRLPQPRSKRSTAQRTETGKLALYSVATMQYHALPITVIEVDTESIAGNHTLSTLMVGFSTDALEGLKEVMQFCSDEGVRWNRQHIGKISSFAEYCNHPKRIKKSLGVARELTPEEYRQAWVANLESRIRQLYQQLCKSE